MSLLSISTRLGSFLLGSVLLAPAAGATDWYVNAVSGSDLFDGRTPGTAWATLTHAFGSISFAPTGVETLHVAPGRYDATLGEQFPLTVHPRLRVVGDAGGSLPLLDAGGFNHFIFASTPVTRYEYDENTSLERLHLVNGTTAVEVLTNWGACAPRLAHLEIEGMAQTAVFVTGWDTNALANPLIEALSIHDCVRGMIVRTWSSGALVADSHARIHDTTITRSAVDALLLDAYGGDVTVELLRSRLLHSGGNGVKTNTQLAGGHAALIARASLIAHNADSGVRGVLSPGALTTALFDLQGCTVAHNTMYGVQTMKSAWGWQTANLSNCIVAGNGHDLVCAGVLSASYTLCQDGKLGGQPRCIGGDPRFANPTLDDFRLRFDSPCLDAGDPALVRDEDLAGRLRDVDGNLDLAHAVDIGALEFEPLHLSGTPSLGQPFALELWGESGGHATLLAARGGLCAPLHTTFGDFLLVPARAYVVGAYPVAPGRPTLVHGFLPDDPMLLGRTWSFQALTDSSLGFKGRAYTNGVEFTLQP